MQGHKRMPRRKQTPAHRKRVRPKKPLRHKQTRRSKKSRVTATYQTLKPIQRRSTSNSTVLRVPLQHRDGKLSRSDLSNLRSTRLTAFQGSQSSPKPQPQPSSVLQRPPVLQRTPVLQLPIRLAPVGQEQERITRSSECTVS